MKRSQILNIITDAFYHVNVDADEATELANKLLTELEDYGMLPPTYTYWNIDKDGKRIIDISNGEDFNQWEPE